jgi:hypothetical protein
MNERANLWPRRASTFLAQAQVVAWEPGARARVEMGRALRCAAGPRGNDARAGAGKGDGPLGYAAAAARASRPSGRAGREAQCWAKMKKRNSISFSYFSEAFFE